MLSTARKLKVRLVRDEEEVRPQEAQGGFAHILVVLPFFWGLASDRRRVVQQIDLPEIVRQKIPGERFDEHTVVDPYQMQSWVLCHDNLSSPLALGMQGVDIRVGLGGHDPQMWCHTLQIGRPELLL